MASARATTLAQGFSKRLLLEMYDISLLDHIVNRDYEGEINGIGSKLNILNIARISEKDYTGVSLGSPDSLYENNCVLTIEKKKSFYWKEMTIDNWASYIKDPHSTVVTQKADERLRNMDLYVLGLYGDVGAGNRVGTDYVTGTVTITATTGVVEGAGGMAWDSTMVGKGFKAAGHTKWYRVKSVTDSDTLVIEDDYDDTTSAYTGGAIGGGASYIIEAATPVAVTTTNFLAQLGQLKIKLDTAERNGFSAVPDSGRFLIVPAEFEDIASRATGVLLHIPEAYNELVKKGLVTYLKGFQIFMSNRLTGDNTNGFHCIAGHKNWMTFAEKLLQAQMEEDIFGDFGTAYKDLFVYGAKVPDSRRHFAAELFATFS